MLDPILLLIIIFVLASGNLYSLLLLQKHLEEHDESKK